MKRSNFKPLVQWLLNSYGGLRAGFRREISLSSAILFQKKLAALSVCIGLAVSTSAQTQPMGEGQNPGNTLGEPLSKVAGTSQNLVADVSAATLLIPASVDLSDTLSTKRRIFSTNVYEKGQKLTNSAVIKLLEDTRQAKKKFQLSILMKPAAALLAVSGVWLGYEGIKGTEQTAMIRGVRTPGNSNVPDVQVNYVKRSLPKVLGGLGLFLGGLLLVELSNDLTAKSVVLYNVKSVSRTSVSMIKTVKVGLTTSGGLGLEAHL